MYCAGWGVVFVMRLTVFFVATVSNLPVAEQLARASREITSDGRETAVTLFHT